ncbi:hypothetical protein B0H14DRAFT_3468917 [Mycena olivaceomarginata]|nr:hypothetical protein B0H14DRAFT_3468917 [Mycena olivaceomarginata]
MVELGLEHTFQDLSIGHEVFFHPRPGFEQKEGSQSGGFYVVTRGGFYVVTRGCVPGIYTHWEDASPQIHRFPGAVHKKYIGWSAATSAWDGGRRPHTPPAQLTPPSTPSSKTYGHVRVQPSTPAHARPTDPAPDTASGSAPSTPTRSRKALYVCSQGRPTTIYRTHPQAFREMFGQAVSRNQRVLLVAGAYSRHHGASTVNQDINPAASAVHCRASHQLNQVCESRTQGISGTISYLRKIIFTTRPPALHACRPATQDGAAGTRALYPWTQLPLMRFSAPRKALHAAPAPRKPLPHPENRCPPLPPPPHHTHATLL